jgi:predicted metal-dependent hydrolase
MTHEEEYEFQELLKKKQSWIQKAIKEIQQGNDKKAIQLINFDSGCNIELIKVLESEPKPDKEK